MSLDSLWIANIDGSGEMKLLDEVYQVAWAPNGRWLSCIREDGLWIISPDGTTQVKVLTNDEQKSSVVRLAWSPDSTKIAFVQTKAFGKINHLGIIDIDNDQTTYLIDDAKLLRALVWSPDGQWLAFSRANYYVEAIDVVNTETITLDIPVFCGGTKETLAWSPKSDRLALLSFGGFYDKTYLRVKR